MENTYSKIQELLHQKADCQARLNLLPYDGTPEIKDRDKCRKNRASVSCLCHGT